MAGKLTLVEIERTANAWRSTLQALGAKLMLFVNNLTPDENTVLADLTEATFDGYGRQSLDFSAAAVMTGAVAAVTPAALTFTKSAGATSNNVYGYGVLDNAGTTLLWAEKDPAAPIAMAITGAQYTVTAKRQTTDT